MSLQNGDNISLNQHSGDQVQSGDSTKHDLKSK